MLFNSIDFAIFLPLVLLGYWLIGASRVRGQNLFLLLASYVFYGWWSWKLLGLIIGSSLTDYVVGLALHRETAPRRRKLLLITSLVVNLGLLGFFKYYNFFIDSVSEAFSFLGVPVRPSGLELVLPVGISFYTFQTLSYSIDIYRRKMEPTRDWIAFFAYVSFFPQLVAGPIERARNLIPQFLGGRRFDRDRAKDGLYQIVLGLFKKVVIADNAAKVVESTFSNTADLSGSVLFVGVLFFAFQVYADFCGYSDIAIGTARLFGFSLMRNFANPYFSRDVAEFWRRWHISLSTWFRDYVFYPLGGSRGAKWKQARNIMLVFTVSGLWHGANWNFVVWGALNGLYLLPLVLREQHREFLNNPGEGRVLPAPKEMLQMAGTFALISVGFVLFRAESMAHATQYMINMFRADLFTVPGNLTFIPLCLFLLTLEWFRRDREHALQFTTRTWPARVAKYALVAGVVWAILLWGDTGHEEFIYFQF